MPIIAVYPDVVRAYNRVEVNWADTPAVDYARVLRYDVETGTCTPLRPYICYEGDYLLLSCGHAVFYDTEVPLDREVYYITQGLDAPCIPADPVIFDSFTRVLVDNWGSPDIGPPWGAGVAPATQYDVNGTQGTITPNATNADRYILIDAGRRNHIINEVLTTNTTPTGASTRYGLVTRWVDAANYFKVIAVVATTGLITLEVSKVVAGVTTVIATQATAHMIAASDYQLTVETNSDVITASIYPIAATPPVIPDITIDDPDLGTFMGTFVGPLARRETGNLTPTVFGFDDFQVNDICLPCTEVTADTSATPTTMPSNGAFRLRDPVRPCHDVLMPLCFTQANLAEVDGEYCIPGSGVFFASMDTEAYASNSLILNPTNAKYPLSVNRTRRAVASNLTVVTRTFDDRDALLTLNEPGSPILIQGPPAYGIPDRYMAVSTVEVQRGLTDHRFQVRIIEMPFIEVARPAGPSQGVCGSQVDDLCDFTWGELAAEGNTWEDLIRGRPTGGTAGYRTWTVGTNTVLGDFADWNAVNSGTRDWTELEIGL